MGEEYQQSAAHLWTPTRAAADCFFSILDRVSSQATLPHRPRTPGDRGGGPAAVGTGGSPEHGPDHPALDLDRHAAADELHLDGQFRLLPAAEDGAL
jgi:hypothetical protein